MKNRSISGEHLIRFRKRLEDEERSAATVEKYLRDVAQFASFLAGGVVTKASVARWKERLLEEGQSPSTVNGKLTALDRFLAFAGWADCRVRHLKISHCGGRPAGQSRDISQGQDPCHSHPWQAVPQAAEIRQETKNRLR